MKKYNRTPLLHKLMGRKRRVAAVMLEALQGEGGIRPGDPDFFKIARKLCDENGSLLICDEVQVGMGRSGKLWGFENLGVIPDVFTSAKALGGGVPIGAMMANGEAATTLGPGQHATTYGGNPLASAAGEQKRVARRLPVPTSFLIFLTPYLVTGLAVAKQIVEKDLLNNVQERGEQLLKGLEDIKGRHGDVITDIRGWGLLRGVELSEECGMLAGEVVGKAMESGLLLVPAGLRVVRFVPPLVVGEKDIEDALKMFEAALVSSKK